MGSVPIFVGVGASPLKLIETKFSVNTPALANAPHDIQWKQSLMYKFVDEIFPIIWCAHVHT